MTISSADLLRMLGSAAAPSTAQSPAGTLPPLGLDFASLLKQAGAGALSSGLGVTVASGVGVQLSSDQLTRISAAADQAQAQGSSRALVLIDGRALTMDVAVRQVTGEADLSKAGVLTGIDSVVSIPSSAGPPGQTPSAPAAVVPLPPAGFASPSLLRLLGGAPAS